MPISVKVGNRTSKVEVLEQNGNDYQVRIDDRLYQLDVAKVENGVYSLIHNGHSINMEMIEGDRPNKYFVNTRNNIYHVEVLDARARYLAMGNHELTGENVIVSPMPGKIVRVPVSLGEKISKGDVLVVVSAMKMESEYRSQNDGVVSRIYVKEGDTVDGNQKLVEIKTETN